MSAGYRDFPACCRRLPVSLGCTPLRQSRSYAFMVCHACYSSFCRTCPYLRMALPFAAQGRISGREGRHTLCHPYRCRAPEEGRPRACGRTTCPGPTWLGTSMLVTRPHAAAETRAASGSFLLGRIRTGRIRRVPQGTRTFLLSSGGYSNGKMV